jgi:hypothetical protein
MFDVIVLESSVADVVIAVIRPLFVKSRAGCVNNLAETVHESSLDFTLIKIAVGIAKTILS